MSLSTIVITIYVIGILIGAFFLDIWGVDTTLFKAMIGVVWTALFLICLFYSEKKDN